MTYCAFCGNEIGYLPFKCKYCGGIYCKKHRLPENHECTFELKHVPVVTSSTRESRQLYQDIDLKSLPSQENREKNPRQLKKFLKKQEKQRRNALRSQSRFYKSTMTNQGTKILIGIIIGMSIISLLFDVFGAARYIYFSLNALLLEPYIVYTLITSLFIAPAGGIFGIFILFIIIFFLYNMARNIELRFGTKFLLTLYIICCLLSTGFFILLRFSLHFLYPIEEVPVYSGFAWGGIYGLFAFSIFPVRNQKITTLMYFIPIRMKGRTFLLILVLIRLIPGLILALIDPIYLVIYLPDLGGILGAYLIFRYRYRVSYRRENSGHLFS